MGSFVNFPRWQSGGVSFFTQTGIFTSAVMLNVMSAATQHLPVGRAHRRRQQDRRRRVNFLDYVANNPRTEVVGLYVESIRNPRAFLARASEVREQSRSYCSSPVAPRRAHARRLSHTGSLASCDQVLDGALRHTASRAPRTKMISQRAARPCRVAEAARPSCRSRHHRGALGVIGSDLLVEATRPRARGPRAGDPRATPRSVLPDWLEAAKRHDFWIGIDVKGPREAHEVGLAGDCRRSQCRSFCAHCWRPPTRIFRSSVHCCESCVRPTTSRWRW